MSDKPVIGDASANRVLAPDGRVARPKNECIAMQCGELIDKPHQWCKRHYRMLPKHLADALYGEIAWCRENKTVPDFATHSLMNACIQRVALVQAELEPAFKVELLKLFAQEAPRILTQ
ncbi:MAG TPA: hypothetical protein VET26_00780 [Candidatus Sulfotelmatobacter sp.]|nr:hypothetical protein [Candidatus Sulfotelmatobacter sp.]